MRPPLCETIEMPPALMDCGGLPNVDEKRCRRLIVPMQLGPWTAIPLRSAIAFSSSVRRVPSSVPRSMKPSQNSTIEGAPIASASRTTFIAPATGTAMMTESGTSGSAARDG